ncbi:hypothetical protein, partial [Tenacibaculum maritimum]
MKKYIILATLILFISCKVKTPIVKLTTSDKYPVILLPSKKNKGVWDISFPFNIAITNPSYKKRRLSYYKYYCNYYYLKKEKKICGKGLMYKLDKGNLLKKSIWED